MNHQRTLAIGLILLSSISSAAIADTNGTLTNASQTPGTETPISRTIEIRTLAKADGDWMKKSINVISI